MRTNFILGLILVFMAFRIGKSVMLYFGDGLEPLFIFAGLAFLLLIGPLLRWYVLGMTRPEPAFHKKFLLELVPFGLIFLSSLFISKEWFETRDTTVIIVFASILLFIYMHLAFYIFLSWWIVKSKQKEYQKEDLTKSQKALFDWLHMMLLGFGVIWISYVLNILEGAVPYVIGPIVYSVVIYFLSFKAFQLKVLELDGRVFQVNDNALLFDRIAKLVQDEKIYLESDISLSRLSDLIGQSTQKTSAVINQYVKRNFNDFINYYRIQESKKLLSKAANDKYTIASIAFDSGFSSLSSFNSAFKKFEGITPSEFRKQSLRH
ncbi:helix-turn-helix domain-containing protein [Flagellimonas beolgyonensis]|uniref:helix-turn-helix domain-containing protein n=1 Tax=Flagellimonas beolgyonensis TaxID=864064 RepID=UPI000F8EE49F|nr:helix-turn-helix domain-containing protein [Allomuricauda beolgyonensis]